MLLFGGNHPNNFPKNVGKEGFETKGPLTKKAHLGVILGALRCSFRIPSSICKVKFRGFRSYFHHGASITVNNMCEIQPAVLLLHIRMPWLSFKGWVVLLPSHEQTTGKWPWRGSDSGMSHDTEKLDFQVPQTWHTNHIFRVCYMSPSNITGTGAQKGTFIANLGIFWKKCSDATVGSKTPWSTLLHGEWSS